MHAAKRQFESPRRDVDGARASSVLWGKPQTFIGQATPRRGRVVDQTNVRTEFVVKIVLEESGVIS